MFFGGNVIRLANRLRSPSIHSRNMHLLFNKALVSGQWIAASDNAELSVLNPANGVVIGKVPDLGVDDVKRVIDAAHTTFHSDEWRSMTAKERSGLLKVSVPLRCIDCSPLICFLL